MLQNYLSKTEVIIWNKLQHNTTAEIFSRSTVQSEKIFL